jgi:hypothetical protein
MKIKDILEIYPDDLFLKADGFDKSVIGIEPNTMKLVYDINKMIKILIKRDKMSNFEAIEFLEFNVFSAYMGENTPIYIKI